jgi:hypothetical protein
MEKTAVWRSFLTLATAERLLQIGEQRLRERYEVVSHGLRDNACGVVILDLRDEGIELAYRCIDLPASTNFATFLRLAR